mmetsp:Transcript_24843/g.64478  ORF Transcript_24843/g.64478 Transcript_24843/m.64478 type:complete len:220 (+) Transcript_24843:827-1486(+)
MCMMSVQTPLRNERSWLTTTSVFSPQSSRCLPSHSTASRSRWLVGSSRKSTSGSWNSAAAMETRMRQPPLSDATGLPIMSSLNCSPRSSAAARPGAESASIASSASYTCVSSSAAVSSSARASNSLRRVSESMTACSADAPSVRLPTTMRSAESCATCSTRSRSGTPGMRPLAIMESRVLLPVPLRPTRPYRCPCMSRSMAPSSRLLPPPCAGRPNSGM